VARQAGVEDEIKRLVARELHDRVAQTLTGMLVDVENFKSEPVGWQDVLQQLDLMQGSMRQVLASVRELLHDLRGEDAMAQTFVDSIKVLATRFSDRSGITVEVEVAPAWPAALLAPASLNLYRIIEEALSNIRLHSGAHVVRIRLDAPNDHDLVVAIVDDGRGLDTDPSRPTGFGMIGMRERAAFLGGSISLVSDGTRGTTVQVLIPRELLAAARAPEASVAGRR
jgi:signal transduction histidine kinase